MIFCVLCFSRERLILMAFRSLRTWARLGVVAYWKIRKADMAYIAITLAFYTIIIKSILHFQ